MRKNNARGGSALKGTQAAQFDSIPSSPSTSNKPEAANSRNLNLPNHKRRGSNLSSASKLNAKRDNDYNS